ncbi:hypothetical protein [Microcoleus sp. herbarium14]|uniref:hypothetical protein n=1 Tax=Microcoleus sp. herbarium14 TaxID=3055439 RepID=UPI002FD213DD
MTDLTRQFAASVCDLHDIEAQLETRPIELLSYGLFDRDRSKVRSFQIRVQGEGMDTVARSPL